ncbi:hypothetical protein Mapa_002443 [Marchantia paleacea]|nr:hypothetical protein Mapa_002443 [Marchantia paleacea]
MDDVVLGRSHSLFVLGVRRNPRHLHGHTLIVAVGHHFPQKLLQRDHLQTSWSSNAHAASGIETGSQSRTRGEGVSELHLGAQW